MIWFWRQSVENATYLQSYCEVLWRRWWPLSGFPILSRYAFTAALTLYNTETSSSSLWRNLWWQPVGACLMGACSTPWWSLQSIPLQRMSCWTQEIRPQRKMRNVFWTPLQSVPVECSCGRKQAPPGSLSSPTQCWGLGQACPFGSRNSIACWPTLHLRGAPSGSPAVAAGGPLAQTGSSSLGPPSAAGPQCRWDETAPSRTLQKWMLKERPWPSLLSGSLNSVVWIVVALKN